MLLGCSSLIESLCIPMKILRKIESEAMAIFHKVNPRLKVSVSARKTPVPFPSSDRPTGKINKFELEKLLKECRDRNTVPAPVFELSDPTETI